MIMKYLPRITAFLLLALSVSAQGISFKAVDTNDFTTNGFVLRINTNKFLNFGTNGGIITALFTNWISFPGGVTATNVSGGHFVGAGGSPTVVTNGPGLGTSGATISITGTDTAFEVSAGTGSGMAAGGLFTVTFARAYSTPPIPVFVGFGSSAGGAAGTRTDYISSVTTSNFSIATTSASKTGAYIWDFHVIRP